MQQNKLPLPIDPAIPEILNTLARYSTLIIKASPGSGKTTRLPWAIAGNISGKVAVLEPRRLAAKLAANRIAEEEGLVPGKEVGYHFRFERNVTPETKVIFYTEGTFLKKFLSEEDLPGIDVVILDEFHERHLETDLALAFCRSLQKRRNLKIVLMSATLDVRLSEFFPDSKVIEVEGKVFPVDVSYLPNQPSVLNQSLESKVRKGVEDTEGDTLVFLPGMREMLKVSEVLNGNYDVFLLHADLSREEQSLALKPSRRRKIILSTNIAESSVTIPGITVVIDSGIQREAYYSPWNGLKLIHDVPVTQSSAIQRAGRAGRTAPGKCIRLYSEQDFNQREAYTIAEIHRADLTDTFLMIQESDLSPEWFEAPPQEKWKRAGDLLISMGAMKDNRLTNIGKKMLSYPVDSRLSRALVEGEKLSRTQRQKLLRYICREIEEDTSGVLLRRLSFYLEKDGGTEDAWEKCVLMGFIDQVARFRPKQRDFIHYSGKSLKLHHSIPEPQEGLFLILDITRKQEAVRILPIEEDWLLEIEPFPFTEDEEVNMGDRITVSSKTKLGSILIEERTVRPSWDNLKPGLRQRLIILAEKIVQEKIGEFKKTPFFGKFSFWCKTTGKDPSSVFKKVNLSDYFQNRELSLEGFSDYLESLVREELGSNVLESILPDKINLGGRRDLLVHYPEGGDPYVEAPLQDFYGLKQTPSIMNGKVQLTLKLLGPHKRPIQITKDLQSFWQNAYQEMRKEYQREYPKHYWPDLPWEAKPYLLKSHLPKA